MKEIIVLTLLFLSAANFRAQAQSNLQKRSFRYSAGIDFGDPSGNAEITHNRVLGGSVQMELPVFSKHLSLTVNTGVNTYHGRSMAGFEGDNLTLVPVKSGLKYRVTDFFFAAADAGVSILAGKDVSAALVSAPQVGLVFSISERHDIETSVRYESTSAFPDAVGRQSFVGLRVAYAWLSW